MTYISYCKQTCMGKLEAPVDRRLAMMYILHEAHDNENCEMCF